MAKPGLSPNAQSGLSELWARLRFVLLAIIIYRIGTHIPVPGINPDRLADMFNQNEGTILHLFNMFSHLPVVCSRTVYAFFSKDGVLTLSLSLSFGLSPWSVEDV